MDCVFAGGLDVPVWVHIYGVNVCVVPDGFDYAGIEVACCVPGSLLLGIGEVHVFSGGCGFSFLLLLVELHFHAAAALMSQHGVEQFLSHLGGAPFHCCVGSGAWGWSLILNCEA